MIDDRLTRQIAFLLEIDKLKQVHRRTSLLDESRRENDAEHSWHFAMFALVLCEHAKDGDVDLVRVLKLALIHDLVEIDAGDTYCYDEAARQDQPARERRAADRLFALLPSDQAADFRGLWDEFEARETPDARFAAALDRFQPLLHNYHTEGSAWLEHGITVEQVVERNRHVADGSPELWRHAHELIRSALDQGWLTESRSHRPEKPESDDRSESL